MSYSIRRRKELHSYEKERESRRYKGTIKMTIDSFVRSKWRFVDLETGNIWKVDSRGEFKHDHSRRIQIKELK